MAVDVLVVGAGPTGLVLALWLVRQGRTVRIIDKSAGPGETSRAMVVQARTLELYRQLDLAEKMVAAGHCNPAMNLWVGGRRKVRVALGEAGAALTPYPFVLVYPQDRHEHLLAARLQELGVTVERQTELVGFEDSGAHVSARLRMPGGNEQVCEALYLTGCDGASSIVRRQLGASFEGSTYRQRFYVADVTVSGIEPRAEAHIALDGADLVAVLPYDEGCRHRLIGVVRDGQSEHLEALTFAHVSQQAITGLGLSIDEVSWFSTYQVHHRVADRFRRGRTFLLGDAAHVHSPVGGQGLNTGIGDAINLAWKIATVLRGEAPDRLLDSYESERQKFARVLVETTDRVFTFVTADGNLAKMIRRHLVPALASVASRFGITREVIFRRVSQTAIGYRFSDLSAGTAGKVRGGDRLPWVSAAGVDNYDTLAAIGWQVHVYGPTGADLRHWCEERSIPVHAFRWQPAYHDAGFQHGAAYLLRPDTYVALADPTCSPGAMRDYFAERGFNLAERGTGKSPA